MNVPNADNINHVVVFMTGQSPFPDGLGGGGKYTHIFHTYEMSGVLGHDSAL